MFVLFNNNKEFIGYGDDVPDIPILNIFKLKLPEHVSDITKYEWSGDMFNGKMIEREKNS
jgi:hypothetical protein